MGLTPQILVVEDDFLIALELEQTLRRAGYEVVGPVISVGMALRLLRQVRPDAAVLDVNLPANVSRPSRKCFDRWLSPLSWRAGTVRRT